MGIMQSIPSRRNLQPSVSAFGPRIRTERRQLKGHTSDTKRRISQVLYQPAERLTLRRTVCAGARRLYPIGPPYVFAMDVPVGRTSMSQGLRVLV